MDTVNITDDEIRKQILDDIWEIVCLDEDFVEFKFSSEYCRWVKSESEDV